MLNNKEYESYIGKYYESIKEIYISGKDRLKSYGKMTISKEAKSLGEKYYLHPAILDPCVYLIIDTASRLIEKEKEGRALYLPLYFREVNIYKDLEEICHCVARILKQKANASIIEAEFCCYSDEGEALLEVQGMQLKKIDGLEERSERRKINEKLLQEKRL